jgi:hypothetical protein
MVRSANHRVAALAGSACSLYWRKHEVRIPDPRRHCADFRAQLLLFDHHCSRVHGLSVRLSRARAND